VTSCFIWATGLNDNVEIILNSVLNKDLHLPYGMKFVVVEPPERVFKAS